MQRPGTYIHQAGAAVAATLLTLVPGMLAADEGAVDGSAAGVTVEIVENVPDQPSWDFEIPEAVDRYELPAFGLVSLPKEYTDRGLLAERSNPFIVAATAKLTLPAGEYRLILRSKNAARLLVDGKQVAETQFLSPNASGHEHVPEAAAAADPRTPALLPGHQEQVAALTLDGEPHEFRLLAFVGGKRLRPEIGEVWVAVAQADQPPELLTPATTTIPLTDASWASYAADCQRQQGQRDRHARQAAGAHEGNYWAARHEIARREWSDRPAVPVPDVKRLDAVFNDIDRFINARLEAAGIIPESLCDDLAFLRRVTLDTAGVIPSRAEIEAFLADQSPNRRSRVIDRLLADPRWADHWVGYWQDVLAENPGILKPTLNNTGPFRWWIHESFSDNKPFDRFATELVRMDGGTWGGGPAGFAMATQNDAPMASKAHVIAKAFLGLEMQCARCHDAPFQPFKQHELFSLAAMLAREAQQVPPTSTVIASERARRPLVEVTLEPGVPVAPAWPFAELAAAELPDGILQNPDDPRGRLAAIITSPRNVRFAQVIVNRLWQRYLGAGLVEPVDDWPVDWPAADASHAELLEYLARELVTHDYDLKHVARLILNSHTYQRAVSAARSAGESSQRLFASPVRRRLSAEQLVDSLFLVAGKDMRCEELTMDPEGRRPVTEMQNLGTPRRAWEFTSLSNERDRPALSLPVAQSIVDVLAAYGWRESRQNPLTVREAAATPLQPMVLANGIAGSRITRLSDDSALTELALEDRPVQQLVEAVFLQILSRRPTEDERQMFVELLSDGYDDRRVAGAEAVPARSPRLASAVSWSNHLSPEATRIKLDLERIARQGDPPTTRLHADWRERMEDMLWALLNSPEFIFVP
ncbi:MAG: DUF1549 and DUF1553 domain-containing protein [Pirellulales bacterium]